MRKEYDGDGVETPVTYDLIEDYKGEVRNEILARYCFDTALEDEYDVETEDGEATIITKEWIEPFEVMKLDLISKYSKDDFWVDLTVEKLETVLKSNGEEDKKEVA